MKSIKKLTVTSGGLKVGNLAAGNKRQIGFQYSKEWLEKGYSLSPMQLPFDGRVHIADTQLFGGLYGVFADSLPDGWGLMLMDRFFKKNGMEQSEIGSLDRLAYIGTRAMGMLEYHPETCRHKSTTADLFALSESARQLVEGDAEDVLEELMIIGGSPGGARPKVTVAFSADFSQCISGVDAIPDGFSHWMVKFPAKSDNQYSGVIEKIYADIAKLAGLDMPETKLVDVGAKRFFATKRFDRIGNIKKHVLTLASFMHADYKSPSMDYEGVLGATGWLTKNVNEIAMAYRLAVFNVLSGNKDDHIKNFSFVMDGNWRLSPAYDLTLSDNLREHTTSMMGSGLPTKSEMDLLARKHGVTNANEIQCQVREAISQWQTMSLDLLPTKVSQDYFGNYPKLISAFLVDLRRR